jgi:hypothetical protein
MMSRIYSPDIKKFLAVAIFKMAAKIQHCPISSKFDMWVDNGVPNSTLFDFKGTFDLFFRICEVLWRPLYEMSLKSDNVEFVRYCGNHFENGDR